MKTLNEAIKSELKVGKCSLLSEPTGGIVNKAAIYEVDFGNVFVKYNNTSLTQELFKSEVESLNTIRRTETVEVPVIIKRFELAHGDGAALVLEALDELQPISEERIWRELGRQVARLHMYNSGLSEQDPLKVRRFGFHEKTFFGNRVHVEANAWCASWQEYFEKLMSEQVFSAAKKTEDGELERAWSEACAALSPLLSEVRPALLHGDFCAANVGQVHGRPVVYDPCSLYGHSEFDFTILHMERNFSQCFWNEYHALIPAAAGSEQRAALYEAFGSVLLYNYGLGEHFLQSAVKLLGQVAS